MSGTNITRLEAQNRSAELTVKSYQVELDLSTRAENFPSKTTVKFVGREGNVSWIDYIAPVVSSIELNGEPINVSAHDGFRIRLDNIKAHNTLVVTGESKYMNTGEGLHRFIDPVDDEVYLYSQFEIADARRVFACFDQPDQKATFQFTITAPKHWTVTSNSPTPEAKEVSTGIVKYEF